MSRPLSSARLSRWYVRGRNEFRVQLHAHHAQQRVQSDRCRALLKVCNGRKVGASGLPPGDCAIAADAVRLDTDRAANLPVAARTSPHLSIHC